MPRPPAAFDTQYQKKGRSASISEFVSRMRPSNRAEKGGTLRDEVPTSPMCVETSSQYEKSVKNQPIGGSLGRRIFGLNYMHKRHALEIPLSPDNEESRKGQEICEEKKNKIFAQRLLRASGDFLGVQGANPRTGIWDSSASSSGPSQMSERSKIRLDEERRNVAEQKRKYEESQARLMKENDERHAAREKRRAEKAEQRKEDQILRQRRHGRWRMGDNGWRSVAEPELSPIVQSDVTSRIKESALSGDDRLFPMPTSANPFPYLDSGDTKPRDHFANPKGSSSLVNKQIAPRSSSIARGAIGTPSASRHQERLSSSGTIIQTTMFHQQPPDSWPQHQESANSNIGSKPPDKPGATPPRSLNSFLDRNLPGARDTTVTLYQSVSTNQAQIHQPLAQSLSSKSQIKSIEDFPPVFLKDPAIAGNALSSQPNLRLLRAETDPLTQDSPAQMPKSMTQAKPTRMLVPKQNQSSPPSQLSFNIPIITTTGYGLYQHYPLSHLDGSSELIIEAQQILPLQRKSSQIPMRTSSSMKTSSRTRRNLETPSPAGQDTATSSEHLLCQTKKRTIELCRKESPVKETAIKNIPTSTSMCPQWKENKRAAHNAALTAVQKSALPKDQKAFRDQSPRSNRPRPKVVPEGPEGTGIHFGDMKSYEINGESYTYERRLIVADGSVGTKYGLEDKLVVWHPSPAKLGKVAGIAPLRKATKVDKEIAQGDPKNKGRQIPFELAVGRILPTVWWFVGPIFDSESGLRKRWEANMITWQDASIFMAAGMCGLCLGLMVIVCGRLVAMCLRVLRFVMGF